jgi:N-acetylglutamate synthase-like GNAT family acetyltransferase
MLALRKAIAADAPALLALKTGAFRDEIARDGAAPPGFGSLDRQIAAIESTDYYAVEEDGRLVGAFCLHTTGPNARTLRSLYVTPERQNEGLGGRIYAMAEDLVPAGTVLSLETPKSSPRNRHFYERCGFRAVGEVTPPGTEPFTLILYEKTV